MARRNKYLVEKIDENEEILFVKKPSFFAMSKLPFRKEEQIVIVIFAFLVALVVSLSVIYVDESLSNLVYITVGILCALFIYSLFCVIKDKFLLPILIDFSTIVFTNKAIYIKHFKLFNVYERLPFDKIDHIYFKKYSSEICVEKNRGNEMAIDMHLNFDCDYILSLLKEKTGLEPEIEEK